MATPPVDGAKLSDLDGKPPDNADFANYFCTYAFLYHQKDMLEDHKRTGAYYNAVMQNKRQFQDKVVLDVGTGSGILALFAAMAGAKKVYAVEATAMAQNARKLVEHNKFANVIEVIMGTVESISLPEKVDIIISEWMGYFLLRESMLDSVLLARDRFLKPGGALYPSHARMFLAPIRSHVSHQRNADFQAAMEGWAEFLREMRNYYNVDMDCLSESFRQEQKDYYLQSALWGDVHPSQMLGPPTVFRKYDLLHTTIEELKAPLEEDFVMHVSDGGPVEGFAGFFDVAFRGSPESPADFETSLNTAPDPTGSTHWGQQTFFLQPHLDCAPGDTLRCHISITRKRENHRLLQVKLAIKVEGQSIYAEQAGGPRYVQWNIE